jgi:hypothetical protein
MAETVEVEAGSITGLAPCLVGRLKLNFFHSLSVTSTFVRIHEALNIDKK